MVKAISSWCSANVTRNPATLPQGKMGGDFFKSAVPPQIETRKFFNRRAVLGAGGVACGLTALLFSMVTVEFSYRPWDQFSEGEQKFPRGTREKGKFCNGELADGTRTCVTGCFEEKGKFSKGELSEGTRRFSTGLEYEGKFVKGKLSEGTITFSTGTKYKGRFVDDQLLEGVIIDLNGTTTKVGPSEHEPLVGFDF